MNKYQKIIDKIKGSNLSRAELQTIYENSHKALQKGDSEAQDVVKAIGTSIPQDKYYVFMGFCPGADFTRRQDERWRELGICDFYFYESEHQIERFRSILPGDLIILKKIEQFGKTMKLFGYGRVSELTNTSSGDRVLKMTWADQKEIIEVPLLACNETVNIKSPEQVDGAMPEKYWEWLGVK
jgi:hypothetical protein